MSRDDVDRLVILGGSLGLGVLLPATSGDLGFATIPLFWATVLIGAVGFFRHVPSARPWLIAITIGWLIVSAFAATNHPTALLWVAMSAVMIGAAVRVRIPPAVSHRSPGPATPGRAAAQAFSGGDDWRDDLELAAFAERAGHLDLPDLAFLAAAWRAADDGARDRAHRAAREALREPDRASAFDAVSAEIRAWSQAAVGPWTWEWGATKDIDRGDRRRAAIPALVDAAAAIIARDAISDVDREALLAPWFATVGEDRLEDAPPEIGNGRAPASP